MARNGKQSVGEKHMITKRVSLNSHDPNFNHTWFFSRRVQKMFKVAH